MIMSRTLSVEKLKDFLKACVFVYRVMQTVAWMLSILVIGINLFFVIEYVVSIKLCIVLELRS